MPAETPEVERFLAYRPYYDPAHVREIQERVEAKGVPFCRECADWHSPSEEHSLVD